MSAPRAGRVLAGPGSERGPVEWTSVGRGLAGVGPGAGGAGERGSMAVFVVLFSVAVLILAGLLVDGGASINARLRAADIAEQTARAAADTIDIDRLRATGEVRISDGSTACGRAGAILAAQGDRTAVLTRCVLADNAQQVTTIVQIEWKATFLSIIGFGGGTMAAEATAGPRTG